MMEGSYLHSLLIPIFCKTSNLAILNFEYRGGTPPRMSARLLDALVRLPAMAALGCVSQQNMSVLGP